MSTPSQPDPKLADGRIAEVFAWGDDRVLKLYRRGWGRSDVEPLLAYVDQLGKNL